MHLLHPIAKAPIDATIFWKPGPQQLTGWIEANVTGKVLYERTYWPASREHHQRNWRVQFLPRLFFHHLWEPGAQGLGIEVPRLDERPAPRHADRGQEPDLPARDSHRQGRVAAAATGQGDLGLRRPHKAPTWGTNIAKDISDLSNYFVTSTGRDLIDTILDALDAQQITQQTLKVVPC